LLTGVLFALSFWQFGLGWPLLFVLFLICNLVVIFLTDLKESLIYQLNSLSLVPAGLLYHLLGLSGSTAVTSINLGAMVLHIPQSFCSALLGVLLAIVFFEGLILLSRMLFGTDGFGHGDTHLMMGAGAFLGWQAMATALLIGFVVQAVPAIPMLVTQWVKDRQYSALVSGGTALLLGILPTVVMNLPNTLWGIALPLEMKTGISFSALALALVAMVVFFRCIKTRASFTYLPLGPALIIGIVLMLYWGTPVQQYYKHLLLS
jgi:prepilin signal peptidase PulO-like enzyme (type II secretory pathway)